MNPSSLNPLSAAIEQARKDYKLCPNRLWEVGSRLKQWESNLPIILSQASDIEKAMAHQNHFKCTFARCEYSFRDFTKVKQRHELESCEDFCYRLRGLFSEDELVKALKSGRRLTAWALDGLSILEPGRPFMAISHVWSDGTGTGPWPSGEVNECLYTYFRHIAEQFECEGIWWDTVCIPGSRDNRYIRSKALNAMQANYEYARFTLVHDCFLRKLPWTDPERACFAIIMSPWFSRGWTALELARSLRVKVVFKDCIMDLDEDILKKVEDGNVVAQAIKHLRRPVTEIEDLLTTLGSRHTSWPRDQANIAALLAGVEISSSSTQVEIFETDIYQAVLRKIGTIRHGHLFHKSATMSNGFSWCATNILELPQVPVNHLQSTLRINQSGEVIGKWRISRLDDIPHERYIWGVSHPLIEDKLRLALGEKAKHVLLVEPDSQVIERGLVVKLMRRPPKEDGPSIKFSFVGPLKLHAGVQARNIVMNITIGDTENWKQLEEGEIAFDILEETGRELNLTVSGKKNASEKYQSRVNPTDANIASWTELHHASWKCDSMIVAQLVQSKVNLDIRDELGRGALHLAAERGNEVIVGLLLGGGANPVQRDRNKQTALHRAIWGGSEIVVEQMLQSSCGQALVNIQDELGRTALHCAAERGNQNMVRSLLANGADPDIQCYRGKQTALHAAISRNSEEVVQVLLQGPNGKKSNPGIKDERGRTAMYCAAEQGNFALVELLSHERLFEVEDNTGLTALRWAVKGGNPKVVRHFLAYATHKKVATATDKDGRTLLHWAASGGNRETCELLISKGSDVMAIDKRARTLLHVGAMEGNEVIVRFCIEKHLNKDARDKDKRTALHLAALGGQRSIIRVLLENKVKKESKDTNGWTALHMAVWEGKVRTAWTLIEEGLEKEARNREGQTATHLAARAGNLSALEMLIKRGVDKEAKDDMGQTALHLAAVFGKMEMVVMLIENGAKKEAKNDTGQTALHLAAMNGKIDVISALIENGAKKETTNPIGQTALHIAAMKGKTDVVLALIDNGADKDAKDNYEHTALHLAAMKGETDVVLALIDNGADKDAKGKYGHTALHIAAFEGKTDAVLALIKNGADKEAKDNYRRTALHLAAMKGETDVVLALIDNGADKDAKGKYGHTALHIAAFEGKTDAVLTLIKNGADKEAKDNYRRTALHLAAMKGKTDVVLALIDNGADKDAKGKYGHTALHIAAFEGKTDAVLALIKNGADKEAKGSLGQTALHRAAMKGKMDVVLALIDNGADKDAKDNYGRTALHLAAMKGKTDVVLTLIDNGADKEAKDNNGQTALHIAAFEGKTNAVLTLIKNGADKEAKDNEGRTALQIAEQRKEKYVVAVLIKGVMEI